MRSFPPFQGEPKWYQFKKICTGHIEYWPERFPQECALGTLACAADRSDPCLPRCRGRNLVCGLLQTDESRRLGLLSGGVQDIKAHAFYSGLDWSALSALKLQPPFKPNEHEWGQATTSPADSKRIAAVRHAGCVRCSARCSRAVRNQELRSSMEHDALISTVQQDIFKGW